MQDKGSNMKKILVSVFLLIFSLCLVGCVDTPNGPGSEQPVRRI